MPRRLLFGLVLALGTAAARADPLPTRSQRTVSHEIDVRLDWPAKRIDAHHVLTWRNDTRDEVGDVWLHLYWNAFRDDESTFARERADRQTRRPLAAAEIVLDRVRVRGGPVLEPRFEQPDDRNERDRTVVAIDLPERVPPGGSVTLEMDWHSSVPRAGVRTGWGPGIVFAAQWFPKPGVYEEGRGWNCHQYHASTEYFADYGTYDVTLHAPRGWRVGATGRETEARGDAHRFRAEDVHDFAWLMTNRLDRVVGRFDPSRPGFPEEARRLARVLGRSEEEMALGPVQVLVFLPPEIRDRADDYLRITNAGLELFGLRYGRFPYETITVVVPPTGGEFVCCMEYPTLFSAPGGLVRDDRVTEWVALHEFGHQFFYGLVGSNEFEEPWLDEGLTSYTTMRALETAFPAQYLTETYLDIPLDRFHPWRPGSVSASPLLRFGLLRPLGAYEEGPLAFARDAFPVAAWPEVELPEPRSEGAPLGSLARYREDPRRGRIVDVGFRHYDHLAYRIAAYSKPSVMLRSLERYLPPGTVDRILRTFSERFRFRHPRGGDFEALASEVAGRDLSWFFDQALRTRRILDYAVGDVRVRGEGRRRTTEVVVRRLGDFVVPVEVAVRFADGRTVREHWDGASLFTSFSYEGRSSVRSVHVDPRAVWWLDVNRTNDSWRASRDSRAARRWTLRLLLWVQHALRFAGGMS